jgi:putative addiction module killer protein
MNIIRQSRIFKIWLKKLKDPVGAMRIARRIERAENGNFGDTKSLGDLVSEMRIATGPGYRLYYMQDGERVYFLLVGGDKTSQKKNIELAKRMAAELQK